MEIGQAVKDPLIQFVVDRRNGRTYSLRDFVERELRKVNIARSRILDRMHTNPWLICPHCESPVYLVMRKEERCWFFRHLVEDDSCPHKTRGELSQRQIDAIRYDGQRESWRHKLAKQYIYRSLRADSGFSNPLPERRWKGQRIPGTFRQPDVQATYRFLDGELQIAFEVQLSTTYLNVIRERRAFYLREGGLLFWIFPAFDADLRRQFQDDIFFNNNSNLFVVDDETVRLSEQTGKFHLKCHYCDPVAIDGEVFDQWKSEIVTFDSLTIKRQRQHAYYFDYGAARTQVAVASIAQQEARLRQDFLNFWDVKEEGVEDYETRAAKYRWFIQEFAKRNVHLPSAYSWSDSIGLMARILASAKEGKGVGFDYKLIQVAHYAATTKAGRRVLLPFGWLCKHYHTDEVLQKEDRSGLWKKKTDRFKPELENNSPEYHFEPQLVPVMKYLFPEIAAKIERSFARQETWRKQQATIGGKRESDGARKIAPPPF